MSDHIPQEFIDEIYQTFMLFDKDQNGNIDQQELGDVFRSLGQHYSEVVQATTTAEIYTDQSGSIEFSEFLQLMRRRMRDTDTEEEMVEAFKVFDLDGNGLISLNELVLVMKQIGENLNERDCEEIIKAGDKDNDGHLNYDEFIRMMADPETK